MSATTDCILIPKVPFLRAGHICLDHTVVTQDSPYLYKQWLISRDSQSSTVLRYYTYNHVFSYIIADCIYMYICMGNINRLTFTILQATQLVCRTCVCVCYVLCANMYMYSSR